MLLNLRLHIHVYDTLVLGYLEETRYTNLKTKHVKGFAAYTCIQRVHFGNKISFRLKPIHKLFFRHTTLNRNQNQLSRLFTTKKKIVKTVSTA